MPFILEPDDNGIIKVNPGPKPDPAPAQSGVITPVKPPVKPVNSGIVQPQKPIVIADDDVKTVIKTPSGFPPKPFNLRDYGL